MLLLAHSVREGRIEQILDTNNCAFTLSTWLAYRRNATRILQTASITKQARPGISRQQGVPLVTPSSLPIHIPCLCCVTVPSCLFDFDYNKALQPLGPKLIASPIVWLDTRKQAIGGKKTYILLQVTLLQHIVVCITLLQFHLNSQLFSPSQASVRSKPPSQSIRREFPKRANRP